MVAAGGSRAQETVKENGASVNPRGFQCDELNGRQYREDPFEVAEIVEFDIAVTAAEGAEAKGGIGIFVGAVGIGSQARADSQNRSTNRIKFSIPIVLPRA